MRQGRENIDKKQNNDEEGRAERGEERKEKREAAAKMKNAGELEYLEKEREW